MDIQGLIEFCNVNVRESSRFQPRDWRIFANAAQMEIQNQTHILEGYFEVVLMEGQRLYSGQSAEGEQLYQLTMPPLLGGTALSRANRSSLAGADLTTKGTPTHVYAEGPGNFGVYPVPDAAATGKTLLLYGKMFPSEITQATPGSYVPPFEIGDHPTLGFGMLLQAERVDKDLQIAAMVRDQYQAGLIAMRGRTNNRMGEIKRVKPRGR